VDARVFKYDLVWRSEKVADGELTLPKSTGTNFGEIGEE
jgi:hypothetical protein